MSPHSQSRLVVTIPLLIFAIILLFTVAYLFLNPYPGFSFQNQTGVIEDLHIEVDAAPALMVGDKLVTVGDVSYEEFLDDPTLELFQGVRQGDEIELRVIRNGQKITIPWIYPGFSFDAFWERVTNLWPVAYIFWLIGTIVFLVIRPRDSRWWLLVAFNYLTAIWFIAGATSWFHYFNTPLVLRSGVWLSLPVYLHLSWLFPRSLYRLPDRFWALIYLLSFVAVFLQWLLILPPDAYFFALLFALLGSLILLALRYLLRPEHRREIRLLVGIGLFTLTPIIAAILAGFFGFAPPTLGGTLFTFPAMSITYIYVVYRHQLGGLELRANRLISAYLFFALIFSVTSVFSPLMHASVEFPGSNTVITISLVIAAAIVAILTFDRFQRFVERRILGIPLPPTDLAEAFSQRITTSLDHENLTRLLQRDILSSMLARQSALLQIDEQGHVTPLYTAGLEADQLPADRDLPALQKVAAQYLHPHTQPPPAPHLAWLRLVLPLHITEGLVGLWLFGRRDPDDFYSQRDVAFLQTLANQTAVALTNIRQAADLRALYIANVNRQEAERGAIARDLHDDVLNQLAVLSMNLEAGSVSADFQREYRLLADLIRQTVRELRPPMLTYGLSAALEELTDDLSSRPANGAHLSLELSGEQARFDADVEAHLFRIVQQASENALRHAAAQHIRISGRIGPDRVALTVADDGRGFELGERLDLPSLLARRRYGLAGMLERAAIINAALEIKSQPGQGTRISIVWTP